VLLMDLQYVPALLRPGKKQAADRMVDLIAAAAHRSPYPLNLFQRYHLMRRWHEVERVSFDRSVDPGDDDRLHHSDWSVRQMVRALADTIVAAAHAARDLCPTDQPWRQPATTVTDARLPGQPLTPDRRTARSAR